MSLGDYFANVPFQTSFHFYSLTNQVVIHYKTTGFSNFSLHTQHNRAEQCVFSFPLSLVQSTKWDRRWTPY